MTNPLEESVIQSHAWKVFSQNGEDGVIAYLLSLMPGHERSCLEIGGNLVNGTPECNTANLLARGYRGVIVDSAEIVHPWFKQMTVTPDNFHELIKMRRGQYTPTVFSLDIDGNDYYILKAMPEDWNPAVVVVEYNASIPPYKRLVQPYDDSEEGWDGKDFFGASAGAMIYLMGERGYTAVCAVASLNLVFVKQSMTGLMCGAMSHLHLSTVFRHPTDDSGRKYLEV
jgi:hypothetical protein